MKEFSAEFVLLALVLSTLLALDTLLAYIRFMYFFADSALLLTLAHSAFL